MTNLYQNPRSRNIFVSNAGDDNYSGSSDDFPKRELSAAITSAQALTPTVADPVAIVESGATRYIGDFTIPDFVRVDMTLSSINNGSLKLPDTSNVELASILTPFDPTGASPKTAVDTNGKSRASLTCLGIVLLGKGDTGYHVSGASSENFSQIGQVSCVQDDCTLIKFDATGVPRQLDFKEVNIGSTVPSLGVNNPSNCIGVDYNPGIASTESLTLNIGSLVNDKAGTGNLGIKMSSGHLHAKCSEIDIEGQDAILMDGGDLKVSDSSDIKGDCTINAGALMLNTLRYIGDISQSTGIARFISLLLEGNITINSGNFNYLGQDVAGNIVINGGLCQFTFQLLQGSFTANSGISIVRCTGSAGTLTVNPGAFVFVDMFGVGSLVNTGGLNGNIGGVEYGSYIDGSAVMVTGRRDGNIQTSYDNECLRLTIDTGLSYTDQIDAIIGSYTQTTNNSRTVNMRVIDADTLTVYWEASNTEASTGNKFFEFDLVGDLVTLLPASQVVNLIVQAERVGNNLSNAGCQIDFTRT